MNYTLKSLAALALATGLILLAAPTARAQHHAHAGSSASPYAGLQGREIKALSEQEVQDYLTGAGMGYAMAAELNGYPGPRHVLEHREEFDLSTEQERQIQKAFEAMQTRAAAIGKQIVEQERLLDQLFAGVHADSASVAKLTSNIADLDGELRAVHLNAHLATRSVLTPEQILRYDELRGYTRRSHEHQH